jgi:rhodanese-related sulfurtransferase
MEEISAADAAALLRDQPESTLLLDVRESIELEMAAVEGALHVPMAEIPASLDRIDKAKIILCLCRSGARSAQVTGFLADQGYDRVINVAGGILAWSAEVDNSIPVY